MSETEKTWDGDAVGTWLERRFVAAQRDQDVADRKGRDYRDEYDKAAAEEFVCRLTKSSETRTDQKRFAEHLKRLLDQEDYAGAGVHDDRRFEREVRAYLRKLMKMTKTNSGFDIVSRPR